jgi:hypothetical protein
VPYTPDEALTERDALDAFDAEKLIGMLLLSELRLLLRLLE